MSNVRINARTTKPTNKIRIKRFISPFVHRHNRMRPARPTSPTPGPFASTCACVASVSWSINDQPSTTNVLRLQQRLSEPAAYLAKSLCRGVNRVELRFRQQALSSRNCRLRHHLKQRSSRNLNVPRKIGSRRSGTSLRNVRGHRHSRSSHLIAQSVSFIDRELCSGPINLIRERDRLIISANVHNRLDKEKKVTVELDVTDSLLQVEGAKVRHVTVPKDGVGIL